MLLGGRNRQGYGMRLGIDAQGFRHGIGTSDVSRRRTLVFRS